MFCILNHLYDSVKHCQMKEGEKSLCIFVHCKLLCRLLWFVLCFAVIPNLPHGNSNLCIHEHSTKNCWFFSLFLIFHGSLILLLQQPIFTQLMAESKCFFYRQSKDKNRYCWFCYNIQTNLKMCKNEPQQHVSSTERHKQWWTS